MSIPNQIEDLTEDEYTALMERALGDKECQSAYRELHPPNDEQFFEFALKYFKAAGEL